MAVNDKKTRFPTVADGAARSIAGPTEGWADVTTSTTDEYVNLELYAGRYVTIEATSADHFVLFINESDFEKATPTTITTGAVATVGDPCPRTVVAGTSIDVVVPSGRTVLVYRTVSGTGKLRVTRS